MCRNSFTVLNQEFLSFIIHSVHLFQIYFHQTIVFLFSGTYCYETIRRKWDRNYFYFKGCFAFVKTVAVSLVFFVDFILFLFSDYCWEIVNILINSIKYGQIMPWTMEQKIFWRYITKLSLSRQLKQNRKKFSFNTFPNRNQVLKLVKKFENHITCEDRGATGSSLTGPLIIEQECARIINNVASCIQLCVQLNDRHLKFVLSGSIWHFRFMFVTKWLQILKWYPFTFQQM